MGGKFTKEEMMGQVEWVSRPLRKHMGVWEVATYLADTIRDGRENAICLFDSLHRAKQ